MAVTATVGTTTLEESDAACFTAHPIEPCRESGEEPFVVGPHSEYTVCSDAFSDANYWKLETTGTKPQGKHKTPFVTMRDGVPGNWCMVIPGYDDKQTGWATSTGGVHFLYFPDDGTCLGGGAGGDPIQTRNSTLFYLAYRGDSVEATPCPGGVLLGADNMLVCLDAP